MNYTKKYSGRSIFALMRAHPGAHCFVLIRFLFLMKSPHSTIFWSGTPWSVSAYAYYIQNPINCQDFMDKIWEKSVKKA